MSCGPGDTNYQKPFLLFLDCCLQASLRVCHFGRTAEGKVWGSSTDCLLCEPLEGVFQPIFDDFECRIEVGNPFNPFSPRFIGGAGNEADEFAVIELNA